MVHRAVVLRRIRDIVGLFDRAEPGFKLGVVVGVWVALGLGAVNFRGFLNDNIPNVLIPLSLLRQADLELSEFAAVLLRESEGERYWAVRSAEGVYSKYPVWTAVAVAPLFVPAAWLQAGQDDEYFWLAYGRVIALLCSAIFAGFLAAGLRRFMPGRWAVFLTFCAVFGSALWHHLGSHLTNQVVAVVCIAVMLWLLGGSGMSRWRAVCLGGLAGLAAAARQPAIFAVACPLGVFVTHRAWRRHLPWVVGAAAIFPALTLLYNASAFGHPLRTGYGFDERDVFSADLLEGAAGLLFSPTCGLLVYSPFVLFGLWAGVRCAQRKSDPRVGGLGVWLLVGVAGQWLLFAKWWCWNGGLSFGCRMMAETVPLLVMLVAFGWQELSTSRRARIAVLILGTVAVAHHLIGTAAYNRTAAHNPIKSDWRIDEDFIALHLRENGIFGVLAEVVQQGLLLAGVLLVGGYLASRFFASEDGQTSAVRRRPSPVG